MLTLTCSPVVTTESHMLSSSPSKLEAFSSQSKKPWLARASDLSKAPFEDTGSVVHDGFWLLYERRMKIPVVDLVLLNPTPPVHCIITQ